MTKETTSLAALVLSLASCGPAEPLPPLTPPPASGALREARVALRCITPGGTESPALCVAYAKAYSDVGVMVVAQGESHALLVTVDQPLGEWGAANHCYVRTYRVSGAPADARPVSNIDLAINCDRPNVADHAVAAWLADPKTASAAAESLRSPPR
jgi:hypothetical protein